MRPYIWTGRLKLVFISYYNELVHCFMGSWDLYLSTTYTEIVNDISWTFRFRQTSHLQPHRIELWSCGRTTKMTRKEASIILHSKNFQINCQWHGENVYFVTRHFLSSVVRRLHFCLRSVALLAFFLQLQFVIHWFILFPDDMSCLMCIICAF